MQEIKCVTERFPLETFTKLGYQCVVRGQKTYNGVAICSHHTLEKTVLNFSDTTLDTDARFVGARIHGVWFYNVYVPNGQEVGAEKYAFKLRWIEKLSEWIRRTHKPSDLFLLAGDFNVTPDDRDAHDPEAWQGQILCSEPERTALENLRKDYLVDTFRLFESQGGFFSWWDYRKLGFPMNKGLRLDLILASFALAKKCKKARIEREERKGQKPSDHAPVTAIFDV
jgi:exodeoxyribonuclease-3